MTARIVAASSRLSLDEDVLARIESYFRAEPFSDEGDWGNYPLADLLKRTLEAALWASVSAEEGRPTRFSLHLLPKVEHAVARFERPYVLTDEALRKVSPALAPPFGPSLVVTPGAAGIPMAVGLQGHAPRGIRIVCHGPMRLSLRSSVGIVAQFEGSKAHYLGGQDRWHLVHSLSWALAHQSPADQQRVADFWARILSTIRQQRTGGTVLVVPPGSVDEIRELTFVPEYRFTPPFEKASELLQTIARLRPKDGPDASIVERDGFVEVWIRERPELINSLRELSAVIAQFAAVDGATLIDEASAVLAFGCKIKSELPPGVDPDVHYIEAGSGFRSMKKIRDLGGTRHQSAARFVFRNRRAIALVCSQDGRLSLIGAADGEDALIFGTHLERWIE